MSVLEKVLAVAIVVGLILWFTLIPGGEYFLFLSLPLLAIVYYTFGFLLLNQRRLRHIFKKETYKDLSGLHIGLAIVAGLALSIVCIGLLFKILLFAGADNMLGIGLPALAIVAAVAGVLVWKGKGGMPILIRALIIGALGALFFFPSELSLVKVRFRHHPAYIQAYENYLADPRNEALLNKKELEYYRMTLPPDEFKRYEESRKR